jgi:hypothetical protein
LSVSNWSQVAWYTNRWGQSVWWSKVWMEFTFMSIQKNIHTWYLKKSHSALLRKMHGMPVSVVTTEPSTLEGSVIGVVPSPAMLREIRELPTTKEWATEESERERERMNEDTVTEYDWWLQCSGFSYFGCRGV